jgi:hypothetical protein
LTVYRAALHILAWTLEMDLDQIDHAPSLVGLPEQPTHPQLHRVEVGDPQSADGTRTLYLTEIPAYTDERDPSYSMESWSCFLNDQQAYELYLALGEVLYPEPSLPVEQPAVVTLPRLHLTSRAPVQSPIHLPLQPLQPLAPPDTEDGYTGQAVRHLPPPPPAATTGAARGPRGPQGPQRGA